MQARRIRSIVLGFVSCLAITLVRSRSAAEEPAERTAEVPAERTAEVPAERTERAAEERRCTSVAHIGDSLTAYAKKSLTGAYAAVGVRAIVDAHGGRATLQKLRTDPKTGRQAARALEKAGFRGCWVVALGTNDTANVAVGAGYSRAKAIDEMMNAIDPSKTARVMWVSSFTTVATGPWANANMQLWNEALDQARGRWPNLRVFDWASTAASGVAPFADGIHHTRAGYEVRNRAIAAAAARVLGEASGARDPNAKGSAGSDRNLVRRSLAPAARAARTSR